MNDEQSKINPTLSDSDFDTDIAARGELEIISDNHSGNPENDNLKEETTKSNTQQLNANQTLLNSGLCNSNDEANTTEDERIDCLDDDDIKTREEPGDMVETKENLTGEQENKNCNENSDCNDEQGKTVGLDEDTAEVERELNEVLLDSKTTDIETEKDKKRDNDESKSRQPVNDIAEVEKELTDKSKLETTFTDELENDSDKENLEEAEKADEETKDTTEIVEEVLLQSNTLDIITENSQYNTENNGPPIEQEEEVPSQPGDPIEIESSSNTITLAWSAPKRGSRSVENYEIKYKELNKKGSKWVPLVTETNRGTATVPDLKCGTEYEFKIRAVNGDGEEGPFSSVIKLSTRLSLAKSVQLKAKKVKDGCPAVYKLPIYQTKASTNYNAKTRKCTFGNPRVKRKEKTIMMVGATGSGKSTLIDGMINYITDVSWEDDFRFSLIDLTDEERKRHQNQAESQTEWITCYTIHEMDGSKIDYDLNIIDTPGFGDTRGIVRDKAIIDQIREFFTNPGEQGIMFLDAVCFVTQAPMARLTPPQRYIFDAILSVFGQDIAKNIFVLITFSDGNEPPVRDALKAATVPFQKSFKFNNSALFATAGNNDEAKFGTLFWKMGHESFRVFFDELKSVESKSLQLTTQVLQLRKNLEATISGLQPQITEGMNQLNTIRQEQEVLKRHKNDIEANRNFVYEVDEIRMRQIDLQPGTHVTNCLTCNRTCHFPCGIPDDKDKRGCAAMSGGNCRVCPKKCHWSIHRNNMFRFETYSVKVKKTYDELKKKYEIAQQEEKKQRSVIGKVKNAFSSLGGTVMKMVHDVRGYINKLNEIALRPNPLSDIDYIDLLIESEKNERKYGWEKRVKLFYRMREEAELVAKTTKANYKPWGEDEKILNEMI